MRKLHIVILLLLSFPAAFSQTKAIKGDTTFWYKINIESQKTFHLKDFEKSTDEFNFRFRNQGQIVEISKDSTAFSGTVTNFIYHTKNTNTNKPDTLSNTVVLSAKQAEHIYTIVQNSTILTLPSEKNIKKWLKGLDGITYIIEYADPKNYWLKSYWTPSAQKSLPEAVIVLNLVQHLSDTLKLKQLYDSFKSTLPKKGCYNSGGIVINCYKSNALALGISGATKLPLGFYSSYATAYIGKAKVNGGFALQYNFDNRGFHHVNWQVNKWNIFYKNSILSDFIAYNYQNRRLKIEEAAKAFVNHQLKYGLRLKKYINIAIGFDYLSNNDNNSKVGGLFYADKWFSKSNISTVVTSSIFAHRINYKAELFKSFNFNPRHLISRISIGVTYEDFEKYKDCYFSVRLER